MKLTKEILGTLQTLSAESVQDGNYATASVVIDSNQNIVGQHTSCVQTYSDPTAHSDLLAVQELCRSKKLLNLSGYSLVTVLEPSLMSIAACSWVGISDIYYLIPADRLYGRYKWITESIDLDKSAIAAQFDSPVRLHYIKGHQDDFDKLWETLTINQ